MGDGRVGRELLDVFQGNATVSAGFSRPAQTLEQGGQGRWSRRDGAGGQECAGPGAYSVCGQAWTAEGVLRKPQHALFPFKRLMEAASPGHAHLKLGAELGLGAWQRCGASAVARQLERLGCVCLAGWPAAWLLSPNEPKREATPSQTGR